MEGDPVGMTEEPQGSRGEGFRKPLPPSLCLGTVAGRAGQIPFYLSVLMKAGRAPGVSIE